MTATANTAKKMLVVWLVLVTAVTSVIVFVRPNTADAQFLPYGGRSLSAIPCTCTGCVMVQVGPPVGGTYMYCPWGTILYEHYNIYPIAWQLGISQGFVPCLTGPFCIYIGGGPLMLLNGTSE